MSQDYCNCCERPIKRDTAVWLVYDNTDGRYYADEQDIPVGNENLGAYPFGKNCAKRALKEGVDHV
jgi:hypothetical protein